MANLLFSHFSDNVAPDADVTVESGVINATYPIENIVDLNPALAAKFTSTTCRVVFDFTTPRRVDVAAIIHHNLAAGLTDVKIEANATNVWGGPTLSAAFTIPAYHEDGMPVNPWRDLTGVAGYDVGGFRFWSIVVGTANADPVAIGDVWLGSTKRTLVRNIEWGSTEGDEWPSIVHVTDFGVKTVYPYGTKLRSLGGTIKTTDAGAAALRALHRDSFGLAKPILIVEDPSVNDALMARIVTPRLDVVRTFLNLNEIKFAVEELSRGLYL